MMTGSSAVGGGSAPGLELPTVLLSIRRDGRVRRTSPNGWLRTLDPPVVARIEHERVVLDLRTVLAGAGRDARDPARIRVTRRRHGRECRYMSSQGRTSDSHSKSGMWMRWISMKRLAISSASSRVAVSTMA